MNPVAIGEFVGAFAITLGVAAIWLLVTYAISPIRRRPTLAYGVAMVLAALISIVPYGGPTGRSIGAGLICIALLYWQMRRAIRKASPVAQSDNEPKR